MHVFVWFHRTLEFYSISEHKDLSFIHVKSTWEKRKDLLIPLERKQRNVEQSCPYVWADGEGRRIGSSLPRDPALWKESRGQGSQGIRNHSRVPETMS